jgi:hypothetical protein
MADSAPTVRETDLYDPIRLAVSRARVGLLFRNHVGVSKHEDEDGDDRVIRHGFPKGSSDLAGWTLPGPVHRGGLTLFVEVKLPGWKPTPKWKKDRQAKWIDAVNAAGGVAFVSRSPEEAVAILLGQATPIYPA